MEQKHILFVCSIIIKFNPIYQVYRISITNSYFLCHSSVLFLCEFRHWGFPSYCWTITEKYVRSAYMVYYDTNNGTSQPLSQTRLNSNNILIYILCSFLYFLIWCDYGITYGKYSFHYRVSISISSR